MANQITENLARAKKPKHGIGAIETGMRLIDVLASAEGPLPLKEIAANSAMPAAKAHRYLASFIATGLVRQAENSNQYDLGPMALRIGVAAQNRINVLERAGQRLQQLRDEIRATCFVTGWTDKGPIVLRWEDSRRPITVVVEPRSIMPLLVTATGRVYLAFMPRDRTMHLIEQELDRDDGTTNDALEVRIQTLITDTCETGLGRTKGDFQTGIAALAAPLYDPLGQIAGAVTALGPDAEFDSSYEGNVGRALTSFTNSLTE